MIDNKGPDSERNDLKQPAEDTQAVLRSIIESPKNVVIFALNRQYEYLAFNENHRQTMKNIWGVDIVQGHSMLTYIKNIDDRTKARKNFDRALSGDSFVIEEEYGDSYLERRYYEDIYNPIIDHKGNISGLTLILTDITDRKKAEIERDKLIVDLKKALSDVKALSGLIPVCSNCKKVRDDAGYWNQLETFIEEHSEALFSHSLCPECLEKIYKDQKWYKRFKEKE